MKKEINFALDIGQSVYIKTDPDQKECIVTGLVIRQSGIHYLVMFDTRESEHYNFELSEERDMNKVLNISAKDE
jgi:hypothetical protein